MTSTAPIVCKPLGTLPLAEVQAFPPAAARALERDHEIRTLADLQPHVEAQGGHVDAVRLAFITLGVRKEHLDQCVWSLLRHLNPGGVEEPAKKEKRPRAKKAAGIPPAMIGEPSDYNYAAARLDHPNYGEGLTPAGPMDGTSAPTSPSPTVDHAADIRMCQDCLRIGGVHEGDCKLAAACPACKAFAGVKCCIRRKPSDKPHKERAALCEKVAPLCTALQHDAPQRTTEPVKPRTNPATDFDENTPPPRTRPIGRPVPRHVRLKPGESVVQVYLEWDKQGRIPAGSVLFERLWSDFGRSDPFMVAASCWPPPLGEPGETLSEAKLAGWTQRVVIEQKGQPAHVVMSREAA